MKDAEQLCHGYRFHPTIVSDAGSLYHHFCLSLRDVEDLLAERGITSCMNPLGAGATASDRNMLGHRNNTAAKRFFR